MSRTRVIVAVGTVASVLVAGALTSSPVTAASAAQTPSIDWGVCAADAPAAFECATVRVPSDHDRPRGRTTTIALTRLPASDPTARRGSLFVNFGGPGGPGVSTLQATAEQVVTPAVRRQYDLVGFDPRAVGESDPATCFATPAAETEFLATTLPFPQDRTEVGRYLRENRDLADQCRRTSADRFRHGSTANVARDLDLLRRAVGDRRLNYLGYSYGTFLGATYARLFPERVGRFVLDGTLDPVKWSGTDGDRRSLGARIGQGPAAGAVFEQFLARCAEAGDRCALNALGDPRQVVDDLWRSLRRKPVILSVAGEQVEFTYATTVAVAFQQLYSPQQFAGLAELLASLARPAAPTARRAPLDLPVRQDYSGAGSALASLCVDQPSRLPASLYATQAATEERRADPFAGYRAWIDLPCRYLRLTDPDAYRGTWRQTTRSTVLVIGTRYDPATPYAATRPFADRFRDARVLTVEGYGHTILGKSACADTVVERYLARGRAPRDGSTCSQSVRPFDTSGSPQAPATPLLLGSPRLG